MKEKKRSCKRLNRCLLCILLCLGGLPFKAQSQLPLGAASAVSNTFPEKKTERPQTPQVNIKPKASDFQISQRLESILNATHWYQDPEVTVKDGVVFLTGKTEKTEYKAWAEDLARHTQDVVAVVNHIQVNYPWEWRQILTGMDLKWRTFLHELPSYLFSVIVIFIALLLARLVAFSIRKSLQYRHVHPLLSDVIGKLGAVVCLLIGLHMVLQIMEWTTIALTVIGGTGLLGIILGMAFRDITENLLASVLLSVQRPFQNGDFVEIDGVGGYIQKLTLRATVLMTPAGNYVQIPNSTVYKTKILNFTDNPNRREEFVVGIGYTDSISKAQEIALKVLLHHDAILKNPEPLVLVDNLGQSSINLRIYFWIDGSRYNARKVKSSVIRLTLNAFQRTGISIPRNTLELSFASETVPIQLRHVVEKKEKKPLKGKATEALATMAEGELDSEAREIKEQALHARPPEEGEDLLKS